MKRGKMKHGAPTPTANGLSHLIKLATYGAVGLGAVDYSWGETVITFEGFLSPNTDIRTIPGYGDNVSANSADYTVSPGLFGVVGTPNITLDWLGSHWDTYTDWDTRGSVAQSDFDLGVGGTVSIMFSPSGGAGVRLVSFQLDEWAGGGAGSIGWSVSGPVSGNLASGQWTMSTAGGRSSLFPAVSGRPGEDLTLSLKLGSGAPSYFALDNLTFDQVPVPEPSTWALGALGAIAAGAAAMRRRRA